MCSKTLFTKTGDQPTTVCHLLTECLMKNVKREKRNREKGSGSGGREEVERE